MTNSAQDYARTNKTILVVFGLGIMVFWPHRKSPSLHLMTADPEAFHCLDCKPVTVWDTIAYGAHLQSHTGRRKPYPVVAVTPEGMGSWPVVAAADSEEGG